VLLSLLVADGMVRARMSEKVNEINRDVIIARSEANLRGTAVRYGADRDVFLILYTGDLCDLELGEREKAAQAFETKLAKLYRLGRGMPKDAVLRDPELYGLPFVDEAWSFMEEAYRDRVRSWRYARPAAAVAGLLGAAFALFGAFQYMQALGADSEFESRSTQLRETLAEIERIRPSDEAMAAVRSGLQLRTEQINEVRLDRMLGWLTHLVPEEASIRALEVEPVPLPLGTSNPVHYPPGEKPFRVKMEIMLPEATLGAAEATGAEIVKSLSHRLQMVDNRIDVAAPEPGMQREVVLVVNAQARAVSF